MKLHCVAFALLNILIQTRSCEGSCITHIGVAAERTPHSCALGSITTDLPCTGVLRPGLRFIETSADARPYLHRGDAIIVNGKFGLLRFILRCAVNASPFAIDTYFICSYRKDSSSIHRHSAGSLYAKQSHYHRQVVGVMSIRCRSGQFAAGSIFNTGYPAPLVCV
jgi:hypothetical protein